MKRIITFTFITIIFIACSNGGDKKTQLEDLKKEQAAIKTKYKRLRQNLPQTIPLQTNQNL